MSAATLPLVLLPLLVVVVVVVVVVLLLLLGAVARELFSWPRPGSTEGEGGGVVEGDCEKCYGDWSAPSVAL